jgi:hypothetical protein
MQSANSAATIPRPNKLKPFDRARAHRLRRAGYSYREIQRELGPMSLWTVWYCLRGIPRGRSQPAVKPWPAESMKPKQPGFVANKS